MAFAEVKAWNPYFRDSFKTHEELGVLPPDTPVELAALIGTPNQYKETSHTEWFNGHAHHSGFTTVFRPNTKVLIGDRAGSSSATVNASNTDDYAVTRWHPTETDPDGAKMRVRVQYRYKKDSPRWIHTDRTFQVAENHVTELLLD